LQSDCTLGFDGQHRSLWLFSSFSYSVSLISIVGNGLRSTADRRLPNPLFTAPGLGAPSLTRDFVPFRHPRSVVKAM
jgi:hypothetical protein